MERQKKIEIDTDRLKDLPHDVLLRISEFMNIKQFVQACILSKRWKHFWKHLTNLKLHHSYPERSDPFCKFVSMILSGRNHSIPLHTLNFEHVDFVDPSKSTLLEVMRYAVSHKVQQLTVNVEVRHISDFELPLPPSIFCCSSLTYLKLGFRKVHRSHTMFPKSLNLPSLKTLHLLFLTFTTSDHGCAEPFSACNMLSTLIIFGCYLQDDAQALCISNSNVSSLNIGSSHVYEEAHNYKIVLCTPKLTSLTIRGRPTFKAPSARDLPFLEEVKIDYIYYNDKHFEHSVMISWMQLIANVKIVTLCYETLHHILWVLRKTGSMGTQPLCFVRLKSLKVELFKKQKISSQNIRRMAKDLLQNSPPARVEIIRNA